jgi:hypothetical protein
MLIELGAEEFIQDSAVEALHEPFGPGSSKFDLIESKVDLIRMGLCAAKFPAVIGKDSFNIDPEFLIKGNNVIMEHRNSRLSNGMKVELPYTFEGANEKSILVEELSRAS